MFLLAADPNIAIVLVGLIFGGCTLLLASQNSKRGAESAANTAIVNQLNAQTSQITDLQNRDTYCKQELAKLRGQYEASEAHNIRLQAELNRVWTQLDELRNGRKAEPPK